MKRSGFRRKVVERAPVVVKAIPVHLRRSATISRIGGSVGPVERFEYVRSRELLDAVKTLPCQHCGAAAPSDPAHSNQAKHGKGKGIKASDVYVAALCRLCHNELDQGRRLTRDQRIAMWTAAWRKTVRALIARGLWPKSIPKIEDFEDEQSESAAL